MSCINVEVKKYTDSQERIENKPYDYFPLPYERKTSVEIINEARASIKAVQTKRPFTPLERNRQLFSSKEQTAWSSASSSPDQFCGEKLPLTSVRLTPLKAKSHIGLKFCGASPSNAAKEPNKVGALNSVLEDVEPKDIFSSKFPCEDASGKPKTGKSNHQEADSLLKAIKKKNKDGNGSPIRPHSAKSMSDLYSAHVEPLIVKLINYFDLSGSELIAIMDELYTVLEANRLFVKNFKERSTILRTVFSLIDQHDTRLLICVSRIVFAMNVTKKNLMTLCKLIYKVSKNEANDHLFGETNFLEIYIGAVAAMKLREHPHALVYSIATIKFLAANEALYEPMLNSGIVRVLTTKMTTLNDEVLGSTVPGELCSHILVQVTAAIRNLLENDGFLSKLVENGSLNEISRTLEINVNDEDVVKNLCRIMSKISVDESCCDEIIKHKCIVDIFLLCLKKYKQKPNIIVRICFVMGNLTAHSDNARLKIDENKKWLDILMRLLDNYLKFDENNKGEKSMEMENGGRAEDVVVKVIRVIANMSIHPQVGPFLAQNDDIVGKLLQILDKKKVETSEELVVCTLSTLNNLSYYCIEDSALYDRQEMTARALMDLLSVDHEESMVEVVNVFGNLSRVKEIRDLIMYEVGKVIISLLDSNNTEIIYSSCGVLMNLFLDQEKKIFLLNNGAYDKLISILQDYGRIDWILCSLVCQTIWNFVSEFNDLVQVIGEENLNELNLILEDFLDPENVLACTPEISLQEHTKNVLCSQWEKEFQPVASDLLHKLTKELDIY